MAFAQVGMGFDPTCLFGFLLWLGLVAFLMVLGILGIILSGWTQPPLNTAGFWLGLISLVTTALIFLGILILGKTCDLSSHSWMLLVPALFGFLAVAVFYGTKE